MNNLVSNAIKYSPPGSEVTLSAAHLGATIELTVSDTGLGMSDEQLGRLFTPFDRLGAENTGIKGTGVGLALTKLLVDLMGGSICVDSQPGKGSRFVIGFAADAGADPAVARQCAATSATA
jgi:signal transduction histidine kinase